MTEKEGISMDTDRTSHYKGEITHDLNAYRETNYAAVNTSARYIFSNLLLLLCIGLIALLYDGRRFSFMFLIFCAAFAFGLLASYLRDRNGAVSYKRILYQHGGMPPHQQLSFEDDGIHCTNMKTGNEMVHPFERIVSLIDTKNYLIILLDLKLFIAFDKHTLEGGTIEDVVNFLRSRCPKLKRKVKKGILGKALRMLVYAAMIIGFLVSIGILLDIPARLSGQISNSMSYMEIAEKLEPLGITGATADMEDDLNAYFGEYYTGMYADYYNKATDLLAELGMGTYDENTWEWTPSSNGVYWFDAEVFDVDHMYTDFLRGVSALDPATLSITDIIEDHSLVNYNSWTGSISLSFCLNGMPHNLQIPFNGDWISFDALSEISDILNAADQEKRLYFASDEGQGALVFYRTPEWAEAFTELTRIPLYHKTIDFWYE